MKKYFNSQDARLLTDPTYGFSLFPVHGINDEGQCTCGNLDCSNKGKHPATPNGLNDASNDIEEIKKLWNGRKYLNVGIATGAPSNIFVIDIDSAEGERNLKALGDLPQTLSASTGKGRHLYFSYPGEPVISKRGILPGVDVRGDGGYVCGPGSNHISGTTYEWINLLEVIQDAPDFILDLVVKSRIKQDYIKPALSIVGNRPSGLHLSDGWSEQDVLDHLKHISPDIGYDEWIKVGMALQNEGYGLNMWDTWSATGSKYQGIKDTSQHWKSFKAGNGVTYGTIVHLAKEGGWKPRSNSITYPALIAPQQPVEEFNPKTGEILSAPIKKPELAQRKLPLLYANDLLAVTNTADFIEGLLCENQFSVIYGESNCGKTFFMMDLAMHVALGRKWRDREIDQGGVIYAALEGGYNTQNRIVAFKQHYGIDQDIPLAIIPSSLNLLDPDGDIHSLVNAIWEAKERIGNIKLIIIDTLSRALHGGDENSSMDMGQLIINADAIRAITGAHISFVHHSGKDAVKGARGHSSLRAAVDTEIEISRKDENSPSNIKVVKQREMEMGEEMAFMLSQVSLGTNQRGKPVTSCVVVETSVIENRAVKMSDIQKFVYDGIVSAIDIYGKVRQPFKDGPHILCISYDELRQSLEDMGFKEFMGTKNKTGAEQLKSSTQAARIALQRMDKISFNKAWIWLLNSNEE